MEGYLSTKLVFLLMIIAVVIDSQTILQNGLDNIRVLISQPERQLPPILPFSALYLKFSKLSIEGQDNNVNNPNWNRFNTPVRRLTPAAYRDANGGMVNDRPQPRTISNTVGAIETPTFPTDPRVSALFTSWGQFLDHDITFSNNQNTASQAVPPEVVPIRVPRGDSNFDRNSTGNVVLNFIRRQFVAGTNPRQLLNKVTGWIDASHIYGSTASISNSLRTFKKGKMNVSAGNLLPLDNSGNFVAGDLRSNENSILSTLHTIFLRQHNRLCKQISSLSNTLTDQQIYTIARHIVAGFMSHITYDEWLPNLIGDKLYSKVIGEYIGYDSERDPRIAIQFDTAAFRIGHSLLVSNYSLRDNIGRVVETLSLADLFSNSSILISKPQRIDQLMNGITRIPAKKKSCTVINDIRNTLIELPVITTRSDLLSINIQRGRDSGLLDYSSMRVAMGLSPGKGFQDVTSNSNFTSRLSSAYTSYSKLDPFVGIICEDSLDGAVLGKLGGEIVARIFRDLRDGNRMWYQNYMPSKVIQYIKKTKLSDIINRNTKATVQQNVFLFND